MNPAATLALAAGKLRLAAENANRAHPAPWNVDRQVVRSARRYIVVDHSTSRRDEATAVPLIAMMNPIAAVALADWLEAALLDPDMERDHASCDRQICAPAAALAVARAILDSAS